MDHGGPFRVDIRVDIRAGRVDVDAERGPRGDVMGPYPTRRAAENAVVRMRARRRKRGSAR